MMKTYCFDLDGTLCSQEKDYNHAIPFLKAINEVNRLYGDGNRIIIFTARGANSGIDWTEVTRKQLSTWGLKYHDLIMNKKPSFDIVVDDKAISAYEWREQISKLFDRGVLAGAFDLIHPGYIRMFKEAKANCRNLTVLLHSYPDLQRNKMSPVHSLMERIEILSSIKWVDEIISYKTEEDLEKLLIDGKYDVRFLGNDYVGKEYTAKHLNIPIVFFNRDHGYSTTSLKKKISESYQKFVGNNE
jgi:glycerol-3-phosphate cytidylyltransferase